MFLNRIFRIKYLPVQRIRSEYVWKCCLRRAKIGGKEIVRNYGSREEGEIARYAYTNFTDFKPLKPYFLKKNLERQTVTL